MEPTSNQADKPDDAELVALSCTGDQAAFETLVQRYQTLVWQVVAATVGNAADAEDVCQQAFILAYENLGRFDASRAFGPWLKTIARNQALNHIRRKVSTHRHLHAYQQQFMDAIAARQIQDQDQELQALASCLGELNEPAGECLRRYYVDGWNMHQIAESLGRGWDATRKYFTRLKKRLRLCIDSRLRKSDHAGA